jgi:hypothetical protein
LIAHHPDYPILRILHFAIVRAPHGSNPRLMCLILAGLTKLHHWRIFFDRLGISGPILSAFFLFSGERGCAAVW